MPVIKSAIKKLRQDRKREETNDSLRKKVREITREVKTHPTAKSLEEAFSTIDKAAKNNIFHKNKAARLKSRLSKLVKTPSKTSSEPKKTAAKPKSTKSTAAKNK